MERVTSCALLVLACLPCGAQQPEAKVTQEKVEQTSRRRVTLAMPGRAPYQNTSLRVECLHTEETVQFVVEEADQFTVAFDAPLETAASGVVSLRVKLDERPPASHEWTELPDHKGYVYSRYPGSESNSNPGLSLESRKLLEDARIQKDTLKFLGELLAAKTVQVEFQPAKSAGPAEAQFNASNLRAEFDKYPECKAYYRISK